MDISLALKAIVKGLLEGFAAFLPIPSAGHLVPAGRQLDFTDEKSHIANDHHGWIVWVK